MFETMLVRYLNLLDHNPAKIRKIIKRFYTITGF